MTHYSKILALTMGNKSLFLAELATKGTGSKPAILNLAEFPFPQNLSLATPTELGAALAAFLNKQKITTRDLIIGLPARRLLTRRKDLPPAAPAIAASSLRLQAETEFSTAGGAAEADPLIADFAGQTSSSDPSSVLLIATAQSAIDQCLALAKAANLRLRGITAASAALANATNSLAKTQGVGSPTRPADDLILSLSQGAAELVVQHAQSPTNLRHIAFTAGSNPESIAALAGEIRRSVASLQRNGAPLTLALWDGGSQDASSSTSSSLLEERLGMPVSSPDIRSLLNQAQGLQSLGSSSAYAPAIATALAALTSNLPVDFLHSRLAPPKSPSKHRPLVIAISIAAAIVLLIVAGFVDLQLKQSHLDDLRQKSDQQANEVKIARTGTNRLDEANKWIHRNPRFVPCLRDLTALFPDEGTIWATSLSLSTNIAKNGTLTGKAAGEPQVRALKDLMLKSKQFLDATPSLQEAARPSSFGGSPEISFSITFTYRHEEAKK